VISIQQLASALYGVGRLYQFDIRAWDYFDKTNRGFWSSFYVALVLAPIQIGHRLLQYDAAKVDLDFIPYAVVQVLSYVLTWTLFPFTMLYITRLLDRTPRYLWHMIPYNWMQLPLALPLFSMQLMAALGVVPVDVLGILSPIVLVAFAVYGTFVAAIGLQVATGTALSLVVLDYVIGLIAQQLISRI
jgi:hypothetical protein